MIRDEFSVMFLISVPTAAFSPVSVTLSPTVTYVSESYRFVMFSTMFTMYDVAPESTIESLPSYVWFDVFALNSLS